MAHDWGMRKEFVYVAAAVMVATVPFAIDGCGSNCDYDMSCRPEPTGRRLSVNGCASSYWPDDAECLITRDTAALFVSASSGSDAASGKKDAPLATIGAAIARGAERIFVCGGDYRESLTVERDSAIMLLGGLSCSGGAWRYAPREASVRVIAPAVGESSLSRAGAAHDVALEDASAVGHATGAALRVHTSVGAVFEDFVFQASDALAGRPSVAVVVSESKSVEFKRVVMIAGVGGRGADGAHGVDGAAGKKGNPAANGKGGAWQQCTCASGGDSVGGQGGDGGPVRGADGTSGEPVIDRSQPNWGAFGLGAASRMDSCATGRPGADGQMPKAASGLDGQSGQGGGGGGGGVSLDDTTGGGGGGGCGGCGGRRGGGGAPGGWSVAIGVYRSDVSIEQSQLVASRGGDGGNAGNGGNGGNGGGGGDVGACSGGPGGEGSPGTGGAGGKGGSSVAIMFTGTPPRLDGALVHNAVAPRAGSWRIGLAGAGGRGGEGGRMKRANLANDVAPSGEVGAPGAAIAVIEAD